MLSKILTSASIALIKLYKYLISPLLPNSCRFYPSCSTYGLDALRKYGLLKGSLLTAKRVLRCNPLSKGGYDPLN